MEATEEEEGQHQTLKKAKVYTCCEGMDTHLRGGVKTKRRIRICQFGEI